MNNCGIKNKYGNVVPIATLVKENIVKSYTSQIKPIGQ